MLPITLYDALHNAFWLQMLRTFDKAHATFRDALMHGNAGFQMHPAAPRRSYHTARTAQLTTVVESLKRTTLNVEVASERILDSISYASVALNNSAT